MTRARFDVLRTKGHAAITGSYTTLGAVLAFNWRLFKIVNNTDGDMFFSLNGTDDNLFVPAGSFTLYDLSTNAQNVQDTDGLVMALKSQFYIRYSTAPTSGDVWLEGIFAGGI